MVTIAEQPCYTLINTFDDSSEVPNEQQLKHDLGKFSLSLFVPYTNNYHVAMLIIRIIPMKLSSSAGLCNLYRNLANAINCVCIYL